MENKRLSNKLNSWFWFILTILPIIFIFISCIILIVHYREFDYDTSNKGLEYINQLLGDFDFWNNALVKFNDFTIDSIYDTFYNLFLTLGMRDNYDLMATIFGWMLSVQIYHLIYDVLKFIIGWCHHLIEKAY